MRIVFIGRDGVFNRRIIKELSAEHEIAGCFFVEPNRGSLRGKLDRIKKRTKKYPVSKVINEIAFHSLDRLLLRKKETEFYKKRPEYYFESAALDCPLYNVESIHNKEYIETIKQMKPDIIFSICCSVIFKPELYNIPALGTYVLHEGITPEYRGLHNNLWALMNKDFGHIGYTVLKVSNEVDGGKILVQGKYSLNKNENYRTWGWVNHNAIIEGLGNIKEAFKQLEINKTFAPVETMGRVGSYYTWIGATTFFKLLIKNYAAEAPRKYYYSVASLTKWLF